MPKRRRRDHRWYAPRALRLLSIFRAEGFVQVPFQLFYNDELNSLLFGQDRAPNEAIHIQCDCSVTCSTFSCIMKLFLPLGA